MLKEYVSDTPRRACRPVLVMGLLLVLLSACSNGSGTSERGENTLPNLQLSDGDVVSGGSSIVRISASDDTGITSVTTRLLRQGNLEECRIELSESGLQIANSLLEGCLADQPSCGVEFLPVGNEIVVYPPPLYAPVGLEYELSLVDRDGSITDPIKAVFCFDVPPNEPPQPADDTYQLVYPSVIQRGGVIYDARCEKQDGSAGVLANDDDDEHVGNTCLTAELLTLPSFAQESFQSSFRSDGGFRYEGIGDVPPSDGDGVTKDSFTYRVSDGVNPPSAPITVTIIFSGENAPPVLLDDTFTIAEDSDPQSFSVLTNDTDPDALPLSITRITDGPTNGVANIRNGVLIEYQPNSDFSGRDQFRYTVLDSGGLTVSAAVEIIVSPVNDAPDAENDSVSTDENVSVVISVLANDTDKEGDTLSVSSVVSPANGEAIINADGTTITYTPTANFSGIDPFEYTISDGNEGADTATAIVTVRLVNVPPSPVADNLTVAEGGTATLDLLANDIDNDADPLTITAVGTADNGVVEIVSSSVVRYTPNAGFTGSDRFSYTVSDSLVEAQGEVTVVVTDVNGGPTAVADAASTNENTPVSIQVLANDTDPDGDELTVTIAVPAGDGEAAANSEGEVVYTPDTDFVGVDTFRYQIADGAGETSIATVTVTVSNVNAPPDANDDDGSTQEEVAVSIDVLDNDSDPDGDALTVTITTAPINGTAAVSGGVVLYTPEADFSGTDQFTYQVADPDGATDSAVVSILVSNVNVAPVAVDDEITTEVNDPVRISVLVNDTDADGDTLSIVDSSQPDNGSAVVRGVSIIYTPATGFAGVDSFNYQITDGNDGNSTATVTVTVTGGNTAPVAENDSAATPENTAVSINVLDNDSDADGDALSISVTTQGDNGSGVVATGAITYTPDTDFTGTDTLVYEINDGNGGTDTATVTITVSETNQAPVATDDTASTSENTAVTVDVLSNDDDADGDALTVVIAAPASDGTAAVTADQTIIYTPDNDFTGSDSFIYEVNDGAGGTDTATVTINVDSINAPPVAVDDSAETLTETAVIINVLDNDSDPDGDVLSVAITVAAANGVAELNANNTVSYTSVAAFTGTDSFDYTIDDGAGGTATATVTVNVNAVNTPPVATDDGVTTEVNDPITVQVLANDSDEDGDALTVTITTAPASGSASVRGGVRILYTPAADFVGVDSLVYQVDDGNGGTDTATLTITMESLNALPVANPDAGTAVTGIAIEIDVVANDTDADGDTLTISEVTVPGNGAAVILADNRIEYTAAVDFTGTDTFEYTIEDGNSGTATALVTMTVESGNSAPIAIADSASAETEVLVNIDVLGNDTDADLDPLSVSILTPPSDGTALVLVDNTVDYTSDADFIGTDTFEYTIDDGNGGTASALVSVQVGGLLASR